MTIEHKSEARIKLLNPSSRPGDFHSWTISALEIVDNFLISFRPNRFSTVRRGVRRVREGIVLSDVINLLAFGGEVCSGWVDEKFTK